MTDTLKELAKTLTEESRNTRKLENESKFNMRRLKLSLPQESKKYFLEFERHYSNRTYTIRTEARAVHLARAFLKGMPYKVVEQKVNNDEISYWIVQRVAKILTEHTGTEITKKEIFEWVRKKD